MKLQTFAPQPDVPIVWSIEKPCSQLYLRFQFTYPFDMIANEIDLFKRKATLGGLFNGATITAELKQKNGKTVRIYRDASLGDVVEYAQHGVGACIAENNIGGGFVLNCNVLFTESGALQFDNDETLTVTITGLASAAVAPFSPVAAPLNAVSVLMAYAVENPLRVERAIQFENHVVSSDQIQKEYRVSDVERIAIVNDSALESLEIVYSNGTTCEYSLHELREIQGQLNDFVVIPNTGATSMPGGDISTLPIIAGYDRLLILDLTAAKTITFFKTRTHSINFYMIRNLPYTALSAVQNANGSLTNTVEAQRVEQTFKKEIELKESKK